MKNKKITRLIQGILLLTAVTTASPNAIHAATENDLREVMGIGRINKTALQDKTNALTDRLAVIEEPTLPISSLFFMIFLRVSSFASFSFVPEVLIYSASMLPIDV